MARHLFLAQRLSALLLAPLVLIHLGLILYAVRGGLSGAEILARTRGSAGWAVFYGLFVLAAAVHAPLGLRNILREWTALGGSGKGKTVIDLLALIFALALLLLGLRAVAAVTWGSGR